MSAATARRADRCERIVISKGLIHLRAGRPESALALITIASRALDRMRS